MRTVATRARGERGRGTPKPHLKWIRRRRPGKNSQKRWWPRGDTCSRMSVSCGVPATCGRRAGVTKMNETQPCLPAPAGGWPDTGYGVACAKAVMELCTQCCGGASRRLLAQPGGGRRHPGAVVTWCGWRSGRYPVPFLGEAWIRRVKAGISPGEGRVASGDC